MPSFFEMLHNSDDDSERPKLAPDIEAIRLRDSYKALLAKSEFRPGMIVRQKPQAKLYKDFGDNDLAIVLEILKTPIIDSEPKSNTPYYLLPPDLVIASIEEDENFCIYHVDSRRFEPHPDFN